MSVWICVAVAVGGAIGSLLRYAAGRMAAVWLSTPFPWATLLVNALGSLAIGAWAAYLVRLGTETPGDVARHAQWDAAIRVGVLGGLTTFSTFSLETVLLLQRGHLGLAAANVAANGVLGIAAAAAGMAAAGAFR